jgi:catechol 2,3-dioxygenase-like lactoylglutathione lyase family enzyme
MLKINLVSIPVLDQEKALKFYRDILDFEVVHDIPLGEGNRWLTLKSKLQPDGPELLLEPAPLHFAPTKTYQEAIYAAGMPYTQFDVDNIRKVVKHLKDKHVTIKTDVTDAGTVLLAIFDDTCGNYIQILEYK